MGRVLTAPEKPVIVLAKEAVSQHVGRVMLEPVFIPSGTGDKIVLDRGRSRVGCQINDVAIDGSLLRAREVSVNFIALPPDVAAALSTLRDYLLEHADNEGLLAPGTDEPE